jgi:hypothetical protein
MLLRNAGYQPRHLVGAAAGPGGDYELDRLGGLPGMGWMPESRGSQQYAH